MSSFRSALVPPAVLVSIDVAKDRSQLLVEYPNGSRKSLSIRHTHEAVDKEMSTPLGIVTRNNLTLVYRLSARSF